MFRICFEISKHLKLLSDIRYLDGDPYEIRNDMESYPGVSECRWSLLILGLYTHGYN